MNDFVFYTPTRVIFGRDAEEKTGEELKKLGVKNVFIVYGMGSVERSGLLERVKNSLEAAGISFTLFGGAKPNPTLEHAVEGVKAAAEAGADFILAVGGGSVIDTAKGIAHGAANPGVDLWDIWTGKHALTKSLPVGAILTIAAAGSEMSDSAVLTNEETGFKMGINTEFNRCRIAFMNPALLSTLPKYHLAAGVTDIMMHTMERYFIPGIKCELTDEIAEGLLRTVMKNGKIIVEDPSNYDAMAEVMWSSTLSHNNLTECGRGKDFSVHRIGMALSAAYDHIHGATLSAVWGAWARYQLDSAPDRFARFARKVFGIEEADDMAAAKAGIKAAEDFWKSIGMPVTLQEICGRKLTEEDMKDLSMRATKNDTVKLSRLKPLGAAQVVEIYRMASGDGDMGSL
ncbi:MAG: iron-containing alcohol dehydrogenase [Lachnospiraceae bacterium]|nr:iron-containing alcohol dehydrogenase [Lachnospiraceae bacterium]